MNVSATGDAGGGDEVAQRPAGVGADRAVADERDRVLGGGDDLGGALELAHPRLGLDGVAAGQRRGVERRAITSSGSSRWVGAGLLGLGHLERLADDLGHDLGTRHARVPLDDRAQDPDQIDVLVRLLVHPLEVGLTGQGDERRAIEERVGDCGDEVGGARDPASPGRRRRGR